MHDELCVEIYGVCTLAELLLEFGSAVLLETDAVLVGWLLGGITLTVIWMVTLPRTASEPSEQVTVPLEPALGVEQVPCVVLIDTKRAAAGRGSVSVAALMLTDIWRGMPTAGEIATRMQTRGF